MLILIGYPCIAWSESTLLFVGKLTGKMLLSALRGSLWHLQMKQSQLHPQRRDQCNTGDIRNLIFKTYFVLYSLSQCPNISLSTAKLSFNWFSRDPNSNKTTIVPKANLSFCHQSQRLTYSWGCRSEGLAPGRSGTGTPFTRPPAQMVAPMMALSLPCHCSSSCSTSRSLHGLKKGSKALLPVLGCPSLWQNAAGHSHSPAVAKSRSVTVSPHPPEGPTVPWQKSAGYKSVWSLFESKLSILFKEQD